MERMAVRAQTVVSDVLLAALAFAVAFFVTPTQPELGFGQAGAMSFFQLAALYAAIAGVFSIMFRGEMSPWRYVSIPDALVLARSALLTVGVFLLACFVLDRAEGLPRSTLVMAPLGSRPLDREVRWIVALADGGRGDRRYGGGHPALVRVGPSVGHYGHAVGGSDFDSGVAAANIPAHRLGHSALVRDLAGDDDDAALRPRHRNHFHRRKNSRLHQILVRNLNRWLRNPCPAHWEEPLRSRPALRRSLRARPQ